MGRTPLLSDEFYSENRMKERKAARGEGPLYPIPKERDLSLEDLSSPLCTIIRYSIFDFCLLRKCSSLLLGSLHDNQPHTTTSHSDSYPGEGYRKSPRSSRIDPGALYSSF